MTSEIRIRFAPWFGMLFIVVGGFNFFVFAITGNKMQVFLAGLFGLLGLLNLLGTGIVVTSSEVQMRNAFGMTLKRHLFSSLAQLSMEGKTLYLDDGAGPKKIAGLGFHLNGSDVETLRAAIDAARSSSADNAS